MSSSKGTGSGLPSALYDPYNRISSWRANLEGLVLIVCAAVLFWLAWSAATSP